MGKRPTVQLDVSALLVDDDSLGSDLDQDIVEARGATHGDGYEDIRALCHDVADCPEQLDDSEDDTRRPAPLSIDAIQFDGSDELSSTPDVAAESDYRGSPAGKANPCKLGRMQSRLLHNSKRATHRASLALDRESNSHGALIAHFNSGQRALGLTLQRRNPRRPGENASRHVETSTCGADGVQYRRRKSSWTARFVIELAFSRIWTTTNHSARLSSRQLDAAALVRHATLEYQRQHVRELMLGFATGAVEAAWMHIEVAWDETPLKLALGLMTSVLRPLARHWWNVAASPDLLRKPQWKLLTYEEYKAMGSSREVKSGILDVMGLECTVTWPDWINHDSDMQTLALHRERLFLGPRILADHSTGTIAQGLDDAMGELTWTKLEQVMKTKTSLRLVAISLHADLLPANVRTKHMWAKRVEAHNTAVLQSGVGSIVLLVDCVCFGHVLNGIGVRAFKMHQLMPKMYSVCSTLNNSKRKASLMHGLRTVVENDYKSGGVFNMEPPLANAEHNGRILQMTLHRHRYTRSRDGDGVVGEMLSREVIPKREEDNEQLGESLLKLASGHWALPRLQHWCRGPAICLCKGSFDDLVGLTIAMIDRAVIEPMAQKEPSVIRWHTYAPSLEGASLSKLLCDIVRRAIAVSPVFVDDGDDVEEANAGGNAAQKTAQMWRAIAAGKARATVDFYDDDDMGFIVPAATIISEPLDRLSAILQHADISGHALAELTDAGALGHCSRHLFLLTQPADHPRHTKRTSWQLDTLMEHIGFSDERADMVLLQSVSLASQVWACMEILAASWPWRLFLSGVVLPDMPEEHFQRELEYFFSEDGCCVDAWVGEWLRQAVTLDELKTEVDWRALVTHIAKRLKTTNMQLERVLKELKESFPRLHGPVHAETMIHMGALGQLWQHHMRSGGVNPFHSSRSDLAGAGLPVRKFQSDEPSSSQLHCRADVSSVNARLNELKRLNVNATRAEALQSLANMDAVSRERYMPAQVAAEASYAFCGQRPAGSEAPSPLPRSSPSSWAPSDGTSPMPPEVLTRVLGKESGFAFAGNKLRWAMREGVVSEDRGLVPRTVAYRHRFACWERHPGLCYCKDRAVYTDAMALATNLENYFTAKRAGTFVLLEAFKFALTADGEVDKLNLGDHVGDMVVYHSCRRERRSFAPQKVSLALVSISRPTHGYIDDDEVRATFKEKRTSKADGSQDWRSTFEFVSVWSAAKLFLNFGGDVVVARDATRRWIRTPHDSTSRFTSAQIFLRWPDACMQLWPGKYAETKAKDNEAFMNAMLERPAKRQKRPVTGGIKAVVEMPKSLGGKRLAPTPDEGGELFKDFSDKSCDSDSSEQKEPGSGDLPDEEPRPPPPPPPAPALLGEASDYRVLDVPGGVLRFSKRLGALNAHCGPHCGNKCKMDRTLVRRDGDRTERGRPVGLLMAWLQMGTTCEHAAHLLGRKSMRLRDAYAARVVGRQSLQNIARLGGPKGALAQEILDSERKADDGHDEPFVSP